MGVGCMTLSSLCWLDTCTNTKDIAVCPHCRKPWCPDHMAETGLCIMCTPVDPDEELMLLQRYGLAEVRDE